MTEVKQAVLVAEEALQVDGVSEVMLLPYGQGRQRGQSNLIMAKASNIRPCVASRPL